MKFTIILASTALLLSASAFADTYSCTGDNTTGIYTLDVDGGMATFTADGGSYTAEGAGNDFMFDSAFAVGDVSFDTPPTLHLPVDGSTSEIMFHASISDDAGNRLSMTCSPD